MQVKFNFCKDEEYMSIISHDEYFYIEKGTCENSHEKIIKEISELEMFNILEKYFYESCA